ncbi:hypothetical protein QVD17_16627 [Tagetes erecta]|uniref:Nudix hydrolase domain-containing protein n=1 Tax=Tagetes erecta TaxID=13708 RepID=A0AAD8KRX8_TARER|nr:hypothetical protein QVD17_16627 [Tagetes erecta]
MTHFDNGETKPSFPLILFIYSLSQSVLSPLIPFFFNQINISSLIFTNFHFPHRLKFQEDLLFHFHLASLLFIYIYWCCCIFAMFLLNQLRHLSSTEHCKIFHTYLQLQKIIRKYLFKHFWVNYKDTLHWLENMIQIFTCKGTGIWKFPTGVVDEGEDICDAAVREVKEETGIDAKFMEVLAFRQSHKSFFDKSDLFFMCMLQPLSFDIQKQEREIEAAQWMAFEDYAAQSFVQKHDLLRYMVKICTAKREGKYTGFSPVPTITSFLSKQSNIYFNTKALKS